MLYPDFMKAYIGDLPKKPLLPLLREGLEELVPLLGRIADEKWKYRYESGKWTVASVVGHLVDSERIFPYRALRIARRDPGALPSFDEKVFAEHSNADLRTKAELIAEFEAARASTIGLFSSFTPEMLALEGDVSNYRISVDGIGYQMAGHVLHHVKILKERYGI